MGWSLRSTTIRDAKGGLLHLSFGQQRRQPSLLEGLKGKTSGKPLWVLAGIAAVVGLGAVILRGVSSRRQTSPPPSEETAAQLRADRAFIPFELPSYLRIGFRIPVYLYRFHLGWLLGHRFLMLTHRGRTSGLIRQTVVEVIHYDPEMHESVVASGWGKRSDWYRNIKANPAILVQIGRESYQPTIRELGPEEAYEVMKDYDRRLPVFMRPIARKLRFIVDGTEAEQRAHAALLLMVAFRPSSEAEPTRGLQ